MEEWKIILIIAAIVVAGVVYALCWNAGDLSREEEKNAECKMQNAE